MTNTTQETLSTTRRIELVGKKEFTAIVLNQKYKTFVVYVASSSSTPLTNKNFYLSRKL